MLQALKASNEPEHLIEPATTYLKGLKGNLVQLKKRKEARIVADRERMMEVEYERARKPIW